MSFDIGSVVAKVDADITGFKQGMNEAKSQVNSLGSTVGNVLGGIKNFASQISIASAVVAGAFTLMGKSALDSAAEYQQSRIAFETMLGSADKARALLKDISDFAVKTPFELPQLVEGSKKLLAYNVAAKDIIPTMKMLGDITSGVGVDKMPQLILAFGQVKAATKLTGAELRQFSEAGVPLLDALAKNAKKSTKDMVAAISDGAVSFDDVQKALAGMTAEGGKFFNGMASQSMTFNGVVSNIRDQVGRIMRSVMGIDEGGDIREGSIFQKIAVVANNLLTALNNATPVILSLVNKVGDVFNTLGNAMKPVFDWIIANKDIVLQFLTGMALAIGALLILAPILVIAMNPVILIFMAIAAAVGFLYTAWQNNFLGIQTITIKVVTEIVNFFQNYLMPFLMVLVNYFKDRWDHIVFIFKSAWELIRGIIQVAWAIIYGFIKVGLAVLAGDWGAAWDAIKQMAATAWDGIKNIFNGAVDFVKGWGGLILHNLVAPFEAAWNKIKEIVNNIKNAMDPNKRNSPSMVDRLKKGVDDLNNAWSGLQFGPSLNAVAAGVAVNHGGDNQSNIMVNVSLAGAFIGDQYGAAQMAELMGDNIIKRLQQNIRV